MVLVAGLLEYSRSARDPPAAASVPCNLSGGTTIVASTFQVLAKAKLKYYRVS